MSAGRGILHSEKNDFAIAEEVTLRGNIERRPDLVLSFPDKAPHTIPP